MEKTVWELCADALKTHNIDVYPPANKTGECKKNTLFLRKMGLLKLVNILLRATIILL